MQWLGVTGIRRIPDLQWMYYHHVLFQATNVTSLNVNVGRDGRILQAPAHHWIHFSFPFFPPLFLFFLPSFLASSHPLTIFYSFIEVLLACNELCIFKVCSWQVLTSPKTVNYPSPTNVSSWPLVITTSHPYLPLPHPQTGANLFFCH